MDRDPEVTKYIAGPWQDPEKHRAFLEDRMAQTYAPPFGYWAITHREVPDVFLGWVMLLPIDGPTPQAEIGWRLARAGWGQGLATEASKAVIDACFDLHPKTQIIASIHSENSGSLKVAEKIGMSFSHTDYVDGISEHFYRRIPDCD